MEKEEVTQSTPRLFRDRNAFRCTGIPEGRFIVHRQGRTRASLEVWWLDDPSHEIGFESFNVENTFKQPEWGQAVFRVRADGTLHFLESAYDSSD